MKGKNEILINQATMLEAINLWLADQFKTPPKAVDVRRDVRASSGADKFIIIVSDPDPTNQKDQGDE